MAREFRTLRSNSFAKTKKSAKPYLPVHVGPMWSFLFNKSRKSRDTVSLTCSGLADCSARGSRLAELIARGIRLAERAARGIRLAECAARGSRLA